MEKLNKFFTAILVAGMVAFSAVLVIPTQVTQALISTDQIADNAITSPKIMDGQVMTSDLANGAVTKDKISPFALKLVTVSRQANFNSIPNSNSFGDVKCNKGETATGGGYWNGMPSKGVVTFMSAPKSDSSGWVVLVHNPDSYPWMFTAYVLCAHLELGP
jgi:hypothetical protein